MKHQKPNSLVQPKLAIDLLYSLSYGNNIYLIYIYNDQVYSRQVKLNLILR